MSGQKQLPEQIRQAAMGKQHYLLHVVRPLVVTADVVANLNEAVGSGMPADAPVRYTRPGRFNLTLLSQMSINKAARRSRNFGGLSLHKLQSKIWETLPETKSQGLAFPAGDVITTREDGYCNIGVAIGDADMLSEEQTALLKLMYQIGHVLLQPHPQFPFIKIASIDGKTVPGKALENLERAKPATFTLGCVMFDYPASPTPYGNHLEKSI
jgi:hypothetical protein